MISASYAHIVPWLTGYFPGALVLVGSVQELAASNAGSFPILALRCWRLIPVSAIAIATDLPVNPIAFSFEPLSSLRTRAASPFAGLPMHVWSASMRGCEKT
jgi:hypothetical protein